MAKVNLVISVADDHIDQILDVAQNLREAGLAVEQVMDAAGVITGHCEKSQMVALSSVPGVDSVEASQSIQLPSADSPIQ